MTEASASPLPSPPLPATPRRAVGRTLAEFEPLHPAEAALLAACAAGQVATIGDDVPGASTEANHVRGAFVCFLALGGDERAPVGARGVHLAGAWIDGQLDLAHCNVDHQIALAKCRFTSKILLSYARLRNVSLEGSTLPGLHGDGLVCAGNLFLRNGLHVQGVVRLTGAAISNNLECGGAFIDADGEALVLDRARIEGSVKFQNSRFNGEVRLPGAMVTGNLECRGASFTHRGKRALTADGLHVGDKLFWRGVGQIAGTIDFTTAHVGTLVDDLASWNKADRLLIDGFRYDRIAGSCRAESRIEWLLRQSPNALGTDFAPQPWEQLIATLRAMGHAEAARTIGVEKQWARRRAGVIGQRPTDRGGRVVRWRNALLNRASSALHWLYGRLAGFGYRPLWTVGWMLLAWLAAAGAFWTGERHGVFGPNSPVIQTAAGTAHCGAPGDHYRSADGRDRPAIAWTRCPDVPAAYTGFQPLIYSLDLLLPVVDLQQQDGWSPMVNNAAGETLPRGVALRMLLWLEILFGWTSSALLLAVLGKLVDKD